jgi:farnesyl diphosphate synthase
MIPIDQLLLKTSEEIQQSISSLLPPLTDRLSEAMRYSALSTGKRLRPFILLATADMFKVSRSNSIRAASAIEIVHSYSLIHDDLPAMDDDDFRRGLPSCHKKFDEATAILAGDSLLTLAFEILSDQATHLNGEVRCALIKTLAQNIGSNGMAGGQIYDLIYERENISTNNNQILQMHRMKTAQLFIASCLMGAILGSASLEAKQHLSRYGEFFGLAFQFIDDLEDVKQQKSLSHNNIVNIIGFEETKIEAAKLILQAQTELAFFREDGKYLNDLAQLLLKQIQ